MKWRGLPDIINVNNEEQTSLRGKRKTRDLLQLTCDESLIGKTSHNLHINQKYYFKIRLEKKYSKVNQTHGMGSVTTRLSLKTRLIPL